MNLLDGKIAVITGAGSGMGLASTKVFVREGAKVLAADVSGAEEEVAAGLGDAVMPFHTDVSDEAQVEAMFAHAIEQFGHVDIVLNVVGIGGGRSLLADVETDAFDRVLGVNLRGMYFGIKHGLRALVANGGGAMVNWSSLASIGATPTVGVYSASKAGVDALTKSAAVEYGPQNIRVNSIRPGYIRSEIMGAAIPETIGERIPLRRAGEPSEVAELAAFLASDRASYLSGAVIEVDGALSSQVG